ncbi:hypothetical protein C789_2156 [Microcystis aeruginosa FACHB-905 = DIANCHI905]|uniref:Uncharacterized protein n=1 Tax=Microcystis aeruginosa PCC 7806SL TaxID=1903187 RepID=A0AB33BM03_MICA7|nr:hypothetical protein BH695_2191 [Microcystis aeruginosa PCC 7806SL]ELS48049.1 hypothetical protein C789_2156 [Microcystis aeruginosa FACHB-905 = DIANCHI905]
MDETLSKRPKSQDKNLIRSQEIGVSIQESGDSFFPPSPQFLIHNS